MKTVILSIIACSMFSMCNAYTIVKDSDEAIKVCSSHSSHFVRIKGDDKYLIKAVQHEDDTIYSAVFLRMNDTLTQVDITVHLDKAFTGDYTTDVYLILLDSDGFFIGEKKVGCLRGGCVGKMYDTATMYLDQFEKISSYTLSFRG